MRAIQWGTIPELVSSGVARFGDAEALVDGDLRLSYAQLEARVEHSTRAAIAAGVEPGDRVAIWAPNIHEWIVAALGASSAGGVLVPINTRFKGSEAGYVLGKSGARVLFTVNGFLDTDYVAMLRAGAGPLPALEKIVVLRGAATEGTEAWEHYLEAGGSVAPEEGSARTAGVKPDDLSDIIFTSGTTGRPKGVMVTHAQTLRVFEAWSRTVGLTEGDRYLVVMPFFHTFGYKAGWMAALMRGATIVPQAVFDVDQVLTNVAAEKISMLPGAPTLYQAILEHPDRDRYDLSSLRLAVTGAAPVPVEMLKRMRTELTFKTILTAYGLTECTGTATICRADDDEETISGSSGRAIEDVEVLVVDDAGTEVPRGEPGEVVVRGYNVMLGYFEDPEQTAEAIDADGWLHTGDIGVMDERGYLDITDRKKDMIIRGGENIYPAEVENLLLGHGGLAQTAVVGVPDERFGEVVMAYVIPRAGADVTADGVIEWARANMANYKVPKYVEVVDALPVNAAGKILKFELRERAATSAPTGDK